MAKIPEDVLEAFEHEKKMCMVATVDESGSVNVVPNVSLKVTGEEQVAFACCFDGKTTNNLKAGRTRVAIAIYKPRAEGFQIKGLLQKLHDSGELFDEFSAQVNPMLEAMGINGKVLHVATIKVREVYALTLPIAGERLV